METRELKEMEKAHGLVIVQSLNGNGVPAAGHASECSLVIVQSLNGNGVPAAGHASECSL